MAELDRAKWEREQEYLRSDAAFELARSYSDFCKIAKARGKSTGYARAMAKKRGYWTPW